VHVKVDYELHDVGKCWSFKSLLFSKC
jgi:hypothetical protein